MDEELITRNIKKLRKQKKMTLQHLSDLTGLTKGYLSKVERSSKAPPYSTLTKIAGAIGIEVNLLFMRSFGAPHDSKVCFQKHEEAKLIGEADDFPGYAYRVLAPNKPGKNMEPFIIYAPFEIRKMYTHEGEEFIYMMEGQMEFVHGDKTYIMEPGDNIYFDSCIPHSGRSLGDEKAKMLVVIYFYKRNRQ